MIVKYLDGESARNHILNILKDIPHTMRGDSILITCPYHPSPEYPSFNYHRLSINLVPKYQNGKYIPVGLFHCWSCGKVGFFNDLFKSSKDLIQSKVLNGKPLPKSGTSEDNDLEIRKLEEYEEKQDFKDLPQFVLSRWYGSWRGITQNTLRKMGCKSYFDYNPDAKNRFGKKLDLGGTNRLLFYAYDEDKEKIGWVALANEKDRQKKNCLKQKNMVGEWCRKTLLFHEKFKDNTPLILVEGVFDALHLIQEGFNSVSMLGAGNWSDEKRNFIASKASCVIVLFDGDETGYEKGLKVYKSLNGYVPVKRLLLPILKTEDKSKQLDPGNMSEKYIKILRKKQKELEDSL